MSADLANLDPRRVLIIKPSAIGDVVHTLPILRLVRNRWPAAKISWLVTPACSGLLEGHPLLDEVILFDRKRFAGLWRSPRLLGEWRAFTRSLRERHFDFSDGHVGFRALEERLELRRSLGREVAAEHDVL